MTRNKKNWDALVDNRGNYNFQGQKGEVGPKGEVGAKGEQGQKGDAQRVLQFRGEVATESDLNTTATNPKVAGDVWKVNDVNQLWVYNGSIFIVLSNAVSQIKGPVGDTGAKGEPGSDGSQGEIGLKGEPGQRGETGQDGEEGQKGEPGQSITGPKGDAGRTLTYKGEVADEASLPVGATEGDVYKALDSGDFYAWNGTTWDNVGQLNAFKGETGEQGEKGRAGTDGVKGETGEKGERGQKGQQGITGTGQKGKTGSKGAPGATGSSGPVTFTVTSSILYANF